MGFTVAASVAQKAAEIALAMGERDEATVVPGTGGQVLVRSGSRAFLERKDDRHIFKIPIRLKTLIGGVEIEEVFFLCTA